MSTYEKYRARRLCASCASLVEDGCTLTATELDAMIAEQLPSMTCNAGEPQDPQPESQPMVDEPIRIGPGLMWDSETREMWAAMNAEASWKLTEDTTPEAIEATQRAVVEEAMRERPGATAAEISEAVVLPVWNVKRLMEAA